MLTSETALGFSLPPRRTANRVCRQSAKYDGCCVQVPPQTRCSRLNYGSSAIVPSMQAQSPMPFIQSTARERIDGRVTRVRLIHLALKCVSIGRMQLARRMRDSSSDNSDSDEGEKHGLGN
jgi:hypothetical protein